MTIVQYYDTDAMFHGLVELVSVAKVGGMSINSNLERISDGVT